MLPTKKGVTASITEDNMSNIKKLKLKCENLIKEIDESILLDTNSEPFDHSKYLQLITKPLYSEKEVIHMVQGSRLKILMDYFLSNPENTVDLFLDKKGFNEMYPSLKAIKGHPNLQVIISDDVLQNEEKTLFEHLPFKIEENLQDLCPKRLSDFQSTENILLINTKGVDLPSFGIINGYHTLTYSQEENHFLIHFNSDKSQEGEEQLTLKQNIFDYFKEEMAYPYQKQTPQPIVKNKQLQQTCLTQHIRED